MTVWVYNLLLGIGDAVALAAIARNRTPRVVAWSALGVIVLATAIAPLLEHDYFGILSLYACAVFLHGAGCLAGAAALLLRHDRRASRVCLVLAVVIAGIGLDAFLLEPRWLEVTRLRVATDKVRRPIRLVVLADLQTDTIGTYEREVLRRAMEERPDAILLLGDYLQEPDPAVRARLRRELRGALAEARFQAPLGAIAVGGNSDWEDWPEIFAGTPVEAVVETRALDLGELRVTALSMGDSRDPGLRVEGREGLHVVIGHYPDFALGDVRADLLLAGHTHGGQVRLPFLGPVITFSRVPRAWAAGVTDLGEGRTLVVSRGVGMERERAPRMRFLCRPELLVIDLVPKDGER